MVPRCLDSRFGSSDASPRETMYLVRPSDPEDSLIPVNVIQITGNPSRFRLSLKPYDLTFDRLVLRLFVLEHTSSDSEPTILVDGVTQPPQSTSGLRFQGQDETCRMFTLSIALDHRKATEFLARPIDVQIVFPTDHPHQVMISNSLSPDPYSSTFERSRRVNLRLLVYSFQFAFLLLLGMLVLLLTEYDFFRFPTMVAAPVVPTLLFLFGDYINRDRLRMISTRYIFRMQLEYRSVFIVFVAGSLIIVLEFSDRVRCEWIKYRYQTTFEELVHASNSPRQRIAKLAHLVNLAPERRENLLLFQYLLFGQRPDDAFAKVVEGMPVGFDRPAMALALQEGFHAELRTALQTGDAPGCGCVEPFSADDPRLLWIFSLEERLGAITKGNLKEFAEIIQYLKKAIEPDGGPMNPEFGVLLRRYEVVYYSHIPKVKNVEHEKAMESLRDYVDVQNEVRHSILEIAVDQLAESHFLGYCNPTKGLGQYERLFRIRRYNLGSEILREFPPQKLSAFRIISLLKDEDEDFFNKKFKSALQDKCEPNGKTLEAHFRAKFFKRTPPAGLFEADWVRGTPADREFLQTLSARIGRGWSRS